MSGDRQRGSIRRKYPVSARLMAEACRKLANDLRAEHAAGDLPGIELTGRSRGHAGRMSRAHAAVAMDQQAERWEAEANGGPRNTLDRARIGEP